MQIETAVNHVEGGLRNVEVIREAASGTSDMVVGSG